MPRRARSRRPSKRTSTDERREPRRKADAEVVVRGLAAPGARFDQPASTENVSLRGMSLILPILLPLDTPVLVENPTTGVRTLYRVIHVEKLPDGLYRIGFEAPQPHPRFWP